MTLAEQIAKAFHEAYERLAPHHGYETREESAKPWEEVPDQNKQLMTAVAQELVNNGHIQPGPAVAYDHTHPSFSRPESMEPRNQQVVEQLDKQDRERRGLNTKEDQPNG